MSWAELCAQEPPEDLSRGVVITTQLPPCPRCGNTEYLLARKMMATTFHRVYYGNVLTISDTSQYTPTKEYPELLCSACRMCVGHSVIPTDQCLEDILEIRVSYTAVSEEDDLYRCDPDTVVKVWFNNRYFHSFIVHPEQRKIFRRQKTGEYVGQHRVAWSFDGEKLTVITRPLHSQLTDAEKMEAITAINELF